MLFKRLALRSAAVFLASLLSLSTSAQTFQLLDNEWELLSVYGTFPVYRYRLFLETSWLSLIMIQTRRRAPGVSGNTTPSAARMSIRVLMAH